MPSGKLRKSGSCFRSAPRCAFRVAIVQARKATSSSRDVTARRARRRVEITYPREASSISTARTVLSEGGVPVDDTNTRPCRRRSSSRTVVRASEDIEARREEEGGRKSPELTLQELRRKPGLSLPE